MTGRLKAGGMRRAVRLRPAMAGAALLAATTAAQAQPVRPETNSAAEMLEAHNAVRARVGVPPLLWSDQLAAVARQWAETLGAGTELRHRPGNAYGENIYWSSGSTSAAAVVAAWAAEARDYDPRTHRCAGQCGHYTQLVWRNTRYVGCATARGRSGAFWVCNYFPPGNVIGQPPY